MQAKRNYFSSSLSTSINFSLCSNRDRFSSGTGEKKRLRPSQWRDPPETTQNSNSSSSDDATRPILTAVAQLFRGEDVPLSFSATFISKEMFTLFTGSGWSTSWELSQPTLTLLCGRTSHVKHWALALLNPKTLVKNRQKGERHWVRPLVKWANCSV